VFGFEPIDVAAAAILAAAAFRGFFRGLIRESFSMAALAGAVVSVKFLAEPLGAWLTQTTKGQVSEGTAPFAAGVLLAVFTIASVVIVGRFVRRGSRWAGLGWADRAGGALLGGAEGAIVVGILLLVAGGTLGRTHPALVQTRSIAALEQVEQIAQNPPSLDDIDVASPPR